MPVTILDRKVQRRHLIARILYVFLVQVHVIPVLRSSCGAAYFFLICLQVKILALECRIPSLEACDDVSSAKLDETHINEKIRDRVQRPLCPSIHKARNLTGYIKSG